MKKTLLLAGLSVMALNAHADFVGIYAGAGIWKPDVDGNFGVVQNITTAELGLEGDDANFYYVALEHPVPVLPNIRISQTDLKAGGIATLGDDFTFENQTFTNGNELTTLIDLSHTDYTLYYEVLDNVASIDIGATFRDFSGQASIESAAVAEALDLAETVPMLYGRVQIDLPLSGLYVGGTMKYVGIDGNDLQDIEARLGYMTSTIPSLGIELGYRKTSLQIEDIEDLETDLTFDGSYAAVVFHF